MPIRTPYTPVALEIATAANHAKMPKGTIGYAIVTADQTPITTEASLTSLTVTPVFEASRLYRCEAYVHASSDTTGDRWRLRIKDAGTTIQDFRNPDCTATLSDTGRVVGYINNGAAGARTITVTLERTAGTGTLTTKAAATTPATLEVTDIGPAMV